MPKFSERSLNRARYVDPRLMAVAVAAIAASAVDFGITEDQSRTAAEQERKFRQGVSKVRPGPDAKHMIQADGYSKALDLVPYIDGAFTWGDSQWRVDTDDPEDAEPFYHMAEAMRAAAVEQGVRVRWGAVWDRVLNDLPAGAAALKREVESYKARRRALGKSAFLDGPHFELVQ